MSKLIVEGQQPYQDFFLAHPPLQIYLYAGIIKLFGLHLPLLKLLTYLFTVGTVLLIYKITRERYNKKIALIASFLYLSSYNVVVFGSFATGLEIALFFFMAAWYFNKKPLVSGLFFALSVMTRLHLLPLGLILFLISKEKRKFLLGTSVCLIYYGLLLRIPNFYDNVFNYHLLKPIWNQGWIPFIKSNLHLIYLFLLSLKKIKDNLLIYMAFLYLIFISLIKTVFEYYFSIIIVILAIEGSLALYYFKHKKLLWIMIVGIICILSYKMYYFAYSQTDEYTYLINEITPLNGEIMGYPPLSTLIALKSEKRVSKNLVDINFRRYKEVNYSNSLVIFLEDTTPPLPDCKLIKLVMADKKTYEVWDCY